tara:strand:- start:206 stop:529 length:324 start_codon:yes stop_codon:yes gene_type:complete
MKYDTDSIDAIRCYQSVMFDKRQETYFATRQINEKLALEIEILEKINMISIKNDRDHVLVPLTNVSAVYLKSPLKLEQESKDIKERAKIGTPNKAVKPKKAIGNMGR